MKNLSWIVLPFSFLFFSTPTFAHEHHSAQMDQPGTPSGDSLFNLKSHWQDQSGKDFTLSALAGQPAVVAMTYSHCKSSCPLIVEDMKRIESETKSAKLRFVLVSFDSKRDTPGELKKFAAQRKLDPAHWLLLHGSPGQVRELAAVLGVRYREDEQGEFDHSNIISLLDDKGVIRYQQIGLNENIETTIAQAKKLGL